MPKNVEQDTTSACKHLDPFVLRDFNVQQCSEIITDKYNKNLACVIYRRNCFKWPTLLVQVM